jgi:hypothetical protein
MTQEAGHRQATSSYKSTTKLTRVLVNYYYQDVKLHFPVDHTGYKHVSMRHDMCASSHAEYSQGHSKYFFFLNGEGKQIHYQRKPVNQPLIVLGAISSSRAEEYLLVQSECDQDEPQLEQYRLMYLILPPLLHALKMASSGHSHC